MAATNHITHDGIKLEDNLHPQLHEVLLKPPPSTDPPTRSHTPLDSKDPENFLRRCSGTNKKTKHRCNATVTRPPQDTHLIYLPTCKNHRVPQNFAGRCRSTLSNGARCGLLFRWKPPYLELCPNHRGHPETPCYLLNLPLELRYEVFRYLLPARPIGSSTAVQHVCHVEDEMIKDPVSVEDLDKQTRLAMMPSDLHAGIVRLLLGVPAKRFRSILSSYVASSRRSNPRRNSAYHSCYRCSRYAGPARQPRFTSQYPMPLLHLFLVSHQIYREAKELLYSTVAFTIDIRRDGTFMCGRRLLEPRGSDGSSTKFTDGTVEAKDHFIRTFDWAAVKNYNVDIVLENRPQGPLTPNWDEEVEIYDIRDYVAVVVSGILAKSRNLCKLQVRLCLDEFAWPMDKTVENTKLLAGPFERLRNVRQPRFVGVFYGESHPSEKIVVVQGPSQLLSVTTTCSVPALSAQMPVLLPGIPDFDDYATKWEHCISSTGRTTLVANPPIRAMFTEFKDWYTRLANIVQNVASRPGRQAFLHRARVAREHEDIGSFRSLRNELIHYWYLYLDQEEQMRKDMNERMSRMLNVDIYPSTYYPLETEFTSSQSSNAHLSSRQSPAALDVDVMAREGIPMTGNQRIFPSWARYELPSGRDINYYSTASSSSSAQLRPAPASPPPHIPSSPSSQSAASNYAQSEVQRRHEIQQSLNVPAPTHSTSPSPSLSHSLDEQNGFIICYEVGKPGPATWKHKGSAIHEKMSMEWDAEGEAKEEGSEQTLDERRDSAAYVGKGKGKMVIG